MDILENLNSSQKKAVTFQKGPLLIVAGAGTGKTTVITRRIAYLIEQGLAKSNEILATTFTEKAAGEMVERLDKILPYGYLDLWVQTFHAFCQRVLESHGIEIGLPYNFRLYNETQQWILVYNNFSKFRLDYYRPLGNPTKFLHALIRHFSRLKDEAISPSDYLKFSQDVKLNSDSAQFISQILTPDEQENLSKKEIKELAVQEIKKIEEVANAYHCYQQLLLENNSLDFGDLINYCLELFKKRPKILAKFRSQFKYILVDEFQDTNWAQYELIKLLSYPKNNLTVCGCDDQSIYKFRGASISNILQFKEDYPNVEKVYLLNNYRSRQNILDLAYHFIQNNNPNRLEVKLKDEKGFSKKLAANSGGEGMIDYLELGSQEDEMRYVINKILEIKERDKDATWSDFAILVRANSHADIFNYGLAQAKIPYQYVASRGLYNKSVVLDILSHLRLLDNYHESAALYRILSLDIFGFTQKEIIHFTHWARYKGRSLYQALSQARGIEGIEGDTVKKAERVLSLIERHTKLVREKTVKEVVMAFLEDSGYLQEATRVESIKTQETVNYLNQFYKKVTDFELNTPDPSVRNFLHIMDLEIQSGEEGSLAPEPEAEGPECVKVMTIHASKGLEFKYVCIVNVVERRFPTTERKEQIEIPDALVKEIIPEGDIHLQEERRLMYVALTRAKAGVYITGARDYGGSRNKKPSIFIKELGLRSGAPPAHHKATEEIGGAVEQQKEKYKMPGRFSFSQLKAYENCPWQYRFAFILRVPVKGKYNFSFGKTMHSVMQKTFEQILTRKAIQQADLFHQEKSLENSGQKAVKDLIPLEEIMDMYEQCFIDEWYEDNEQREAYYKKGKELLKAYYKEIENQILSPLFLEKEFTIKIPNNVNGMEYSLFGRIDRVDETKLGLELIDYKTGAPKKNLSADDKEQLLLYQLAAKEIFQAPVEKLTFHYLEENKKQSFLGDEKDLEKIKENIISSIHEIEKGEFKATPSPHKCKFCDFKDICDFRQL